MFGRRELATGLAQNAERAVLLLENDERQRVVVLEFGASSEESAPSRILYFCMCLTCGGETSCCASLSRDCTR